MPYCLKDLKKKTNVNIDPIPNSISQIKEDISHFIFPILIFFKDYIGQNLPSKVKRSLIFARKYCSVQSLLLVLR